MRLCQTCGGAIANTPGEILGYAGAFCGCIRPGSHKMPDEWGEMRRMALDELGKQSGIGIAPLAPQKPPTPAPAPTPMTAQEFVVWLRGYFDAYNRNAGNMTQGDWKAILAKLDTLGGPK